MPYSPHRGGHQGNDWNNYSPYQRPNNSHYNRRPGPRHWNYYPNQNDGKESYKYNGWDKRDHVRDINHGIRNASPRARGQSNKIDNLKFKWVKKNQGPSRSNLQKVQCVEVVDEDDDKTPCTNHVQLSPKSSLPSNPQLQTDCIEIDKENLSQNSSLTIENDGSEEYSTMSSQEDILLTSFEDTKGTLKDQCTEKLIVTDIGPEICSVVSELINDIQDSLATNSHDESIEVLESPVGVLIDPVVNDDPVVGKVNLNLNNVEESVPELDSEKELECESLLQDKDSVISDSDCVSSRTISTEIQSKPNSEADLLSEQFNDRANNYACIAESEGPSNKLLGVESNHSDSSATASKEAESHNDDIATSHNDTASVFVDSSIDISFDDVQTTVDCLLNAVCHSETKLLSDCSLQEKIGTKRKLLDNSEELLHKRLKPVKDKEDCNVELEKCEATVSVPKEEINTDIVIAEDTDSSKIANDMIEKQNMNELNKIVQKLDRKMLESLVVKKILEVITSHEQLGKHKRLITTLEETVEKYKAKAALFQKQANDFEIVFKKYGEDAKAKKNSLVTPVRISRSVGLQVQLSQIPPLKSGVQAAKSPAKSPIVKPNNNLTKIKPKPILPQKVIINSKPVEKMEIPPLIVQSPSNNLGTTKNNVLEKTTETAVSQSNCVSKPTAPAGMAPGSNNSKNQGNGLVKVIDLTDDDDKGGKNSDRQIAVNCQAVNSRAILPSGTVTVLSSIGPTHTNVNSSATFVAVSNANTSVMRPQNDRSRLQNRVQAPHVVGPIRESRPLVSPVKRNTPMTSFQIGRSHPAPLPSQPIHMPNRDAILGLYPPKPRLKISKKMDGIDVSWSLDLQSKHADVASYQLFAYQEGSAQPVPSLWKKVGDVKALPLPMACTLTQFMNGHKYHFAVRAVDVHGRYGPFSEPGSILL